ncbi:MAG: hypothetical protein ACQEVA_14730 [Myxococcota bacterium]
MSEQEQHIRIRPTALFAGIGLLSLGIFFFIVGIQYESDYLELSERGETILADVTDVDRTQEGTDTYFKLHYEFTIEGERYTRTDITGRDDQWIEVTEAEWEEASSTGTIPVAYLPEDPTVNWPEEATGDPLTIGYVTEGLGASMLALFLGLIARTATEYKRVRKGGQVSAEDCIMVELREPKAA